MKFLILLALIGAVSALQYPLEYQYYYNGRVGTGVPGIRPQLAALGIRARVILQMRSASQGVVQLKNILVGKMNGEASSIFLRSALQIIYKPLEHELSRQLELPFSVNFLEDKEHVMDVPENDKLWMTNLRKSIIEVLLLEPIRFNKDSLPADPVYQRLSETDVPTSFSIEEETLFGRCQSQYTIVELPQSSSLLIDRMLQNSIQIDVQSRKSNTFPRTSVIPKIEDKIWKLTRSINFDRCSERVILQQSTMSNTSKAGYSQFEGQQSRSSYGIYFLRGIPGTFRVEKAIVEGSVLRRPFGIKTDKLAAITNQTLILEKVSEISSPLQIPATKPVKTWRYEIHSPFSPPFGYPKLWVDYTAKGTKFTPISLIHSLLGIKPNVEELKIKVEEELSKAAEELEDLYVVPSEIPSIEKNKMTLPAARLQVVSSVLEILPIESIEEIFKVVFRKEEKKAELQQVLLLDAAAAAGTSAPMKVLLEYMESRRVSSSRAASIFISLTTQLSSPAIVPEILDYVKTIDIEDSPYLASSALINFAKLTSRLCLNKNALNYTAMNPIYGSEMCKKSIVLEEFLPYLKHLLERLSKPWQKAIVVQAISELGAPETLPILLKVIQKEYSKDPRVVSAAIYALSNERITYHNKREVYDILMKVVDEASYLPELKQAAVIALISHNPPAYYYQRLAKMSWYEKSESTAAFIYFTLRSLASSRGWGSQNYTRKAEFALPLAKPYSPSSYYSFNLMRSGYVQQDDIQTEAGITSLVNLKSILPKEFYVYISSVFSGFRVSPIQFGFFADGVNTQLPTILQELHRLRLEEKPDYYRHPRSTLDKEAILREMRKISSELPTSSNAEFAVLIRMLDNMVAYLPFNKDITEKLLGPGAVPFIKRLTQGVTYNLTKYVEPVEYSYFIPTEIGLPLISSVKMPTVQYIHGHVKLNVTHENPRFEPSISELASERNVSVLIRSNYRLITRLVSKFIVYSPWDEQQIESGVENAKVITLPLNINASIINDYRKKGFKINLSSISKHEFTPLYSHNIPYTAIKTLYPKISSDTYRISKDESLKPIYHPSSPTAKNRIYKHGTCTFTGITGRVHFSGDVPNPFTTANAFEYLRKPIKLQKLLSSPSTRIYTTSLVISPEISPAKNISFAVYYSSGYLSHHQKEELKKSDLSSKEVKHMARKLSPLPSSRSDLSLKVAEVKLGFNATEKRKYEIIVAYEKQGEKSTRNQDSFNKYNVKVFLRTNPIPNIFSEQKEIRIDSETITPNVTSLRQLKERISPRNPDFISIYSIKASIPSSFHNVVELEGKLSVSEDRKKVIREELDEICSYDRKRPTNEFQTAAIYDEGEFNIKYDWEKLPTAAKNYSYIAEEIIKGIYYPYVYVDKLDVQNKPNELSISLNRPNVNRNYKIYAQSPVHNLFFEKVHIPEILVSVVPMSGLQRSCKPDSVESALLPELHLSTCKVSMQKITPFNKESYPFHPLRCYTKIAFDPHHADEFVIEVKKNRENNLKVKVSSSVHAVNIKLSQDEIKVNDNMVLFEGSSRYIVYDENQREVAYLFKVPDGHIYAIVNQRFVIRLRGNSLHLFDMKTHKSLVGACGNTNSFEMVGPEGCIYRQENTLLLKYAYTRPEGSECDQRDYESHMNRVREFQNRCSKKTPYARGRFPTYGENPKLECTKYEYPVIVDERENICIAVEPFPLCASDCYGKSRKVQVKMNCYYRRSAPRHLKEAVPKKYKKYMVNEKPDYEIFSKISSYNECQKY